MKNKSELKSAEWFFNTGNYIHAKDIYSKLLNGSKLFEEKRDYKNKIKDCSENHKKVLRLSAGEAFFPVYDEATGESAVLTLRITDSPKSITKVLDIENVKKCVFSFLDKYLYDEVKNIMVFDWGDFKNLKAEIKEIPHTNKEFEKFIMNIDGKSYELAAAVALISKMLNVKISSKYIFSGIVNFESYNLKIFEVDKVEEKLSAIKIERPDTEKFFTPGKSKDKILDSTTDFTKLIEIIYSNFNNIKDIILSDSSINKLTLNVSEIMSEDNKEYTLFKFGHGSIKDDEGTQINELYKFFKNNFNSSKKFSRGFVIDGLLINYLTPMLISIKEITNHISDFAAVYKSPDKDNFKKAIVIRSSNNANSTRKEGDIFYYQEKIK